MTSQTFTATFSTGETFTRTSNHPYITAAAWVNQETGEIKNVMFSSKENPNPSNVGICWVPRRLPYMSRKYYAKLIAQSEAAKNIWKVETVTL